MTQSELARQSGVSLLTVNKTAQNRSIQVSPKTLDALSKSGRSPV
jgi:transcriptional regulator with XRE-family HTH domain